MQLATNLSSLLPQDHILCGFSAETPLKQILAEMAAPLQKDGIIADLNAFVRAVERRERDMSTLVDDGIAFPHAVAPAVNKLGLAIATILPPGCIFDIYTQQTCRLLFMIAIPPAEPAAHLPLLTTLAEAIHNPQGRVKLLDPAATPASIRKLFCGKNDGRHGQPT